MKMQTFWEMRDFLYAAVLEGVECRRRRRSRDRERCLSKVHSQQQASCEEDLLEIAQLPEEYRHVTHPECGALTPVVAAEIQRVPLRRLLRLRFFCLSNFVSVVDAAIHYDLQV